MTQAKSEVIMEDIICLNKKVSVSISVTIYPCKKQITSILILQHCLDYRWNRPLNIWTKVQKVCYNTHNKCLYVFEVMRKNC